MGASLKLGCIFLASGQSKRFQGNKLLSEFNGRPMIETVLGNFPCELFNQTIVVTRYAEVAVTAAQRGFTVVENDGADDSVARTIRLGLDALTPNLDGCLFSVCDQPLLTARSIQAIVDEFIAHPGAIVALGYRGKRGNPVLFPRARCFQSWARSRQASQAARSSRRICRFCALWRRKTVSSWSTSITAPTPPPFARFFEKSLAKNFPPFLKKRWAKKL